MSIFFFLLVWKFHVIFYLFVLVKSLLINIFLFLFFQFVVEMSF